jgi:curved DNA-binding protein CbpA
MKDNAMYSKARFYELVKIYHPDKSAPSNDPLPYAVKMERYRLIVAANNILSDPTKRSAYDRFGAGWNGRAEVGGRQTWAQQSSGHPSGPFSHNWTAPDDTIWRNATWEDWEQYYYRRAKAAGKSTDDVKPPYGSGLYMQNGYFVVLVALLALIGSTANYNRAQGAGQYYVDQRDIVHDRTAKDLRRVKREASGSGKRQDQIDWFIRNREATLGAVGSDPEVLRQERIDRLLPDREVCKSDAISEKD